MLVTEAVFVVLFAAGFLVVGFFFVNDLALAGSYAVDVLLGRFVRTVSAEQYFQFVTLPAFGAISGGLISTGIAILVDQTPLKHDSKTYLAYLLIVIGLVLIVWGPIRVYKTLAKSENLDIGHRIDRLKAGDWAHDSKPAVIKAIKEKKDAITKKLNNKSRLFPAGLILVIASAAGYYASVYVHRGASPSLKQILVVAAVVVFPLAARLLRQAALRWARKEMKSHQEEADKLSPPAPTAPPSRMVDRMRVLISGWASNGRTLSPTRSGAETGTNGGPAGR